MPPSRPSPPTNVNATDGNVGSVTVTWTAVTGANHYIVYRSMNQGDPGSVIGRTDQLIWVDSVARPLTLYWYSVVTQGAGGCSANSVQDSGYSVAAPVPPLPPTGLQAVVV